MSRWWRAEDTSIDHPKLLRLSDAMFRAWYTLNCVASANDGVLPPTADIAIRLRVKPAKVAEWITKLVAAGLYDNDNGVFRPHNWNKRQYKTDNIDPTNAARQKRYREKHRNDGNGDDSNGSNGVTVKRPEAEAKADSETEQSRADARALDGNGLKQEGMLKAAFSAECANRPKAPDMAIIKTWLLDGISVSTISSTVPPILRRKQDMATLAYCDAAVREAHAKAAPSLQVVSNKVFVEVGTLAWQCHQSESRRLGGRGYPVITHRFDHVAKEGFWFDSEFPPGYDEQTGERLPAGEEHAA